jgi:hypothetical protein
MGAAAYADVPLALEIFAARALAMLATSFARRAGDSVRLARFGDGVCALRSARHAAHRLRAASAIRLRAATLMDRLPGMGMLLPPLPPSMLRSSAILPVIVACWCS